MIPLDVGDGVLLQDGRHLLQNVLVGTGNRQVEHLLEPAFQGQPVVELHQPFRVRPGHIGVRVDHLGFEPEAELHAELRHPVHQRMQTVRPHLGADHPVAEPGVIVAAGTEPAVIEHVTLHPEGGGALRQVDQACGVVVEVDRLPDVQAHRALGAGVHGQGAQVPVETVGLGVQADGVVEIDPGRGVLLPRRQASLPGQEQFAAPDELGPHEIPFGDVDVVPAPGHVAGPDLTILVSEPLLTQAEHEGRISAGSAVAALPAVRPHRERAALRHPLGSPAPPEIHELAGLAGHRHPQGQLRQFEDVLPRVGQSGAGPHQPGRQQLDGQLHPQPGGNRLQRVIDRRGSRGDETPGGSSINADLAHPPAGAPGPALPGADQARRPGPAVPGLGDDPQPWAEVDGVPGDHPGGAQPQILESGLRDLPRITAPVHHLGHAVRAGRQQQRDPGGTKDDSRAHVPS